MPYVNQPEEIIPGRPLFFATAFPLGGVGTGVLVESHEGRPTKIEGNPNHPASLGATDAFAQASILTLYDPDRSQVVRNAGRISTWSAFLTAVNDDLEAERVVGGGGLQDLDGNHHFADACESVAPVAGKISQAPNGTNTNRSTAITRAPATVWLSAPKSTRSTGSKTPK